MLPAAILSIVFSVLQIAVPEVDRIAARHLDKGQCYVLQFKSKTVAMMYPVACARSSR